MKKFLTVLLALSVVFTYSFSAVGTVFADTKTAEEYLDDAYKALSTRLNSDYTTAVSGLTDDPSATAINYRAGDAKPYVGQTAINITFSADVKKQVADEVKTQYGKVLEERKGEILANADTLKTITSYEAANLALIADVTADSNSPYAGENVTEANFDNFLVYSSAAGFQKYFLKYALDEVKKDANDHLSRVDLTLYPETVMDKDDPHKMTHKAYAAKLQGDYLSDLNDIVVTAEDLNAGAASNGNTPLGATDLIAAKVAAAQTIDGKVVPAKQVSITGGTVVYTYRFAPGEKYTAGYTDATPVPLLEKDALTGSEEELAVSKAAALAEVQKLAAEFKKDALTAYKTDANKVALAKAQDEADAFVEVMTVRIAEANQTTIAAPGFVPAFAHNGYNLDATDTYAKVVAAYKALEAAADAAKQEVGEAGTVKYVASIIDDNLAAAKIDVYTTTPNAAAITKAGTIDVTAGALKEASLEWAKEVALAQLAAAEKGDLQNRYGNAYYHDKEAAQVAEAYDKIEAAINACTTVAQVKAVKGPQIDSIAKKAAVVSRIQGLVKFQGELDKLNQYLTAQNMLNNATKPTDDGYKARIEAADLAKFYAKKGARTNDEIVALLAEAQAWAMETPTTKELKDEKAALEAQIAALPKLLALTDKDAVKAAWDANENRSCAAPKNETTLKAAVELVKSLEKDSIDKLINALPAKITAADKAAVQAIADAIKAYNTEEMYGELYTKAGFNLTTAQNAVRDSELAALEEAIAKLPKGATAAQVNAVRDQYDAFVKEYTNALTEYDAAAHVANAYRLFYAEEFLIENVEALKLTASSTAKKGSITVKWKVKGDAASADGYEVFRSVKRNSGYGTKPFFKTTKTTYKNTKSLKKGTRYYYKVRAYKVVDGKTYYSDWSNKAYRIAK